MGLITEYNKLFYDTLNKLIKSTYYLGIIHGLDTKLSEDKDLVHLGFSGKNEAISVDETLQNLSLHLQLMQIDYEKNSYIYFTKKGMSEEEILELLDNTKKNYENYEITSDTDLNIRFQDYLEHSEKYYEKYKLYSDLVASGWGEKDYKPQIKRSSLPLN